LRQEFGEYGKSLVLLFCPHINIDYHPWDFLANFIIYEDKCITDVVHVPHD
jgi:hypothetical protein